MKERDCAVEVLVMMVMNASGGDDDVWVMITDRQTHIQTEQQTNTEKEKKKNS